jgi:exonuclease SbcD
MTKILIVNDPHIADQPPLGRIDNYTESILSKLEEVGEIAGKNGVSVVVLTGDIFHQKRANRVSHKLVSRLIYILKAYPCRCLVVPGNHDLPPDGMAGIKRQPIWTLVEAGAIGVLIHPYIIGGLILIGRPWSTERSIDPKYYALTEKERAVVLQSGSKAPPVILVAHGPIVPPKETRIYDSTSIDQIPLANIAMVAAGHLHDDMGIRELAKGKLFANVGAISRTTRTSGNMLRSPSVLLVVAEGGVLRAERITLKNVLPVDQIFEERVEFEGSNLNEEMVALVESLAQGLQVEERNLQELLATIGADIDEPVIQLVMRYLEEGGI